MKRTPKVKFVADTEASPVEMGTLMETLFAQKCSYVQRWALSGKKKQCPISKAKTVDEAKWAAIQLGEKGL